MLFGVPVRISKTLVGYLGDQLAHQSNWLIDGFKLYGVSCGLLVDVVFGMLIVLQGVCRWSVHRCVNICVICVGVSRGICIVGHIPIYISITMCIYHVIHTTFHMYMYV